MSVKIKGLTTSEELGFRMYNLFSYKYCEVYEFYLVNFITNKSCCSDFELQITYFLLIQEGRLYISARSDIFTIEIG